MSIRVLAVLAMLVLGGCGEKPARKTAPGPAPASATCDDAAAHGAELDTAEHPDQPTDPATLRQICIDEAWPQQVISCVADAASADAVRGCFAFAYEDEPLCIALAQVVEASADRMFASIRGVSDEEEDYDEDEDERPTFPSTIDLPGAPGCTITAEYVSDGEITAYAEFQCEYIDTTDIAEANAMLQQVGSEIGSCLGGWARSISEDGTTVTWQRGATVRVEAIQLPSLIGETQGYRVWVTVEPE